jgi:hypothetical protein
MKTNKNILAMLLVISGSSLLGGCVTSQPNLYQWENYEPEVYDYLKGSATDPQAQISSLEEGLQRIKSEGRTPPPGYYAQLGMLYAQAGKADLVTGAFQAEKKLYPESSVYMDFLMKKKK